jgi:hypothetical protein
MQNNQKRALLMITLLFAFTLGCGLFSGISSRVDEAKETAMALAAEAQQGYSILETARAIATVGGSSELFKTAQAIATSVGDSGLLATAQAFATEQGPELMVTAQAALTQVAPMLGTAPPDIPLMSGEVENLVASEFLITYATQASLQYVADFYAAEMSRNGWEKGAEQSFANSMSIVEYEKLGRKATVTLMANSLDGKTSVVIAIQPK